MIRAARVLGPLLVLTGAAALSGSCTTPPTLASVRSLDRAGKVAFLCLGAPDGDEVYGPVERCDRLTTFDDPSQYGESGRHLYALVTLETRGEVAVVDLSSESSAVLDQDPSIPGENAIPVGALPVDVIASPRGVASFVASAEVARPGIYALPSDLIRPCEADDAACERPVPTLGTWPACKLPSVPGSMVMLHDPAVDGTVRASCDGPYDVAVPAEVETRDLASEGQGRAKLLVTLPKESRVVVLDAQAVLDAAPGSFDDCPVERSLPLQGEVPSLPAPPSIDSRLGCAGSDPLVPRPSGAYVPTPLGVAQSGDRLYIADGSAPLVHTLDTSSPCDLAELDPLLPTSLDDPGRVVVTSRLAVSDTTSTGARFVYAIDVEDKSVMAFDVSETSGSRVPIARARPELDPLQPPDRVRFAAAPEDVAFVTRDIPERGANGLVAFGTRCDPRPEAIECSLTAEACDLGTLYRTSSDYTEGAGPFTLRGTFATVALSTGQLAVIDVEDFDADCRRPAIATEAAGCEGIDSAPARTSDEASCNVVESHRPRASAYLLSNDDVGRNLPGLQSPPLLSLPDGSVVTDGPQMRATIPASGASSLTLAIGGEVAPIDPSTGAVTVDGVPVNTVRMNLEDPRVHPINQEWAVTYRGVLPGLGGQYGQLALRGDDGVFRDVSAGFCEVGVQSERAVRERLEGDGVPEPEAAFDAARLADRLRVVEPLIVQDDGYWAGATCSFEECRGTFGEVQSQSPARELRIVEAFDDSLDVALGEGVDGDLFECCFPTLVSYEIRPGDEWIVVGSATGYDHSTLADPETGACRPSCDPRQARRQGRLRTITTTEAVPDGAPGAFLGVPFRFAIVLPEGSESPVTDEQFRFTTQGAFTPLRVELTNEERPSVQTQQLGFLRATDELFLTDGALEGLLLVRAHFLGETRQFY
jgi:hypothetical protein